MKTAIIDYGAGNVLSVMFALKRLGCEAILTDKEEELRAADKVIFPGVGEAASAMNAIRQKGLEHLIPDLKQPVLGICLGMQLMCRSSEEGKTDCLGIFDEKVLRFEPKLKIPHVGWNSLTALSSPLFAGLKEDESVYFVHSYYVPQNNYSIANTDYVQTFCSAMKKGNFYACQFHPEKSGAAGSRILENFLGLDSNNP